MHERVNRAARVLHEGLGRALPLFLVTGALLGRFNTGSVNHLGPGRPGSDC